MKDVCEITRELIQIESTNPGVGERGITAYIRSFFSDTDAVISEDLVMEDRCNVVVSLGTEWKEPAFVVICHMDTVVTGKDWTRDPFAAKVEGNRIYGRGACDMKSGLACALSVFHKAAKKAQSKELLLKRSLRLICTVDEEGDMRGVETAIRNERVTAGDWVMDLEPTDGQIQMSHKGRFWLEVDVHGVTAHASRPEQGADAIAAMAELICEMKRAFEQFPVHEELGKTTITFGQIQGGYQPYVVPDECRLWIDCRLAPPVNDAMVLEIMEQAKKKAECAVPGVQVEYKVTGNRPFIEKNEQSGLLAQLKKAVRKVTQDDVQVCPFPGYTDTAVIAGMTGNKNCLSYGPGNLKYAHKPDEFVEITDIKRCEKVLWQLIEQIEKET